MNILVEVPGQYSRNYYKVKKNTFLHTKYKIKLIRSLNIAQYTRKPIYDINLFLLILLTIIDQSNASKYIKRN